MIAVSSGNFRSRYTLSVTFARLGYQLALITAGAGVLALVRAFISLRMEKLVGFGIQQTVKCLIHCLAHYLIHVRPDLSRID